MKAVKVSITKGEGLKEEEGIHKTSKPFLGVTIQQELRKGIFFFLGR